MQSIERSAQQVTPYNLAVHFGFFMIYCDCMKKLQLAILFGSRLRGTHAPSSDIDIAVLGTRAFSLREKGLLQEFFARKYDVGETKIDIVDLWNVSPLLAHQVGQTGKLIEGSEDKWIRFRILAWKRYLDTAKFRRMRSRVLREKIYAH